MAIVQGSEVSLKSKPEQMMAVRAVVDDKVVCDFVDNGSVQQWVGGIDDLEEATEVDLFPTKMSAELARVEIKGWLDYKRVKPMQRQALVGHISTLIQAIMYGDIEIRDNFSISHKLNVPIRDTDGNPVFTKLDYKPRITAQELNTALGQAGNDSEISNTIAYGSALSSQPVAILRKLDTSDISIIAAISVFFS